MTESKHTPGPWEVENPMGEDIGLWIVQDGLEAHQWSCIAIVVEDEDGDARDKGGRFIGRTEQQANARLIAAAPEMLEALREIETICSESAANTRKRMGTRAGNALVAARAAIAKTEGRS